MYAFKAAGWFERQGVGWEAAVVLDRDTPDFSHLLGQRVTIDGAQHMCIAINHFEHSPPYRKGARIGIIVKKRQTGFAFAER